MGREEPLSQRLEVIDPTAAPPVWASLRMEAERAARAEPALASLLNAVVLSHDDLGAALSYQLARKLGHLKDRVVQGKAITHGERSKSGLLWKVRLATRRVWDVATPPEEAPCETPTQDPS